MASSDNFWSGLGGAASDLFGAFGSFQEAKSYGSAAEQADQEAHYTDVATGLSAVQAERDAYRVIGSEVAGTTGANLKLSGSALDLLRSSTSQAALTTQQIKYQGEIKAAGYRAQASAYRQQSSASSSSGFGSLLGAGLSIASMFF